ncbi:MAG: DUF6455 family protein [Rhodobacteraceae bacterium]|jgi:hypothetical protein|nr:DUF6455 family protein [Paracoccaceae bacterium]
MLAWMRRISASADRVGRMATTVGTDLGAALEQGTLGPSGLRGAVARCQGCTEACACDDWLDSHAAGADRPPAYCRNVDLFLELRQVD